MSNNERKNMARATNQLNMGYIWMMCLVAACGGLLFGYDWVVIGGAKPFYEAYFSITDPAQSGWAMSSALVGCVFGALISGWCADRLGRKRPLILAAILFAVSSWGTAIAGSFDEFVLYRIMGGVGIGLASALSPMYIAEVSPADKRGKFVAVNQLTIVIGVLAAQLVNLLIAEPVESSATTADLLQSWNGQTGWRWMFGAELVPALAFLVLMFFVPESPRWLAKAGKVEKARGVLQRIGNQHYAQTTLDDILRTLGSDSQKVPVTELLNPKVRPIIVIGIVLAMFQQWCGINVIFNYAQEIFASAGFDINDTLKSIVATGLINLIFTILALPLVDKLGRRKLMLIGSLGLTIIYVLIAGAYAFGVLGLPVLLLVLAAIAIYALTLAPVTWVLLSEIFPNRIRGMAMAVGTFSLWIACFLLTYTFPLLNAGLGASGSFLLYGVICMAGFVFIRARVPETKGVTLEALEDVLSGGEQSTSGNNEGMVEVK
ncbi:sugar porter family MFS transporter [Limnobaculum xujianqingii]|nr:sugar porter family MFS transporter [Limnobaculum xujianqingii]